MANTQTLTLWLSDAEAAYNNLMTGRMPRVVVDQNGERVEYTAANAVSLSNYIQDLKRQLGIIKRCQAGPMRLWM